MTSTKEKEIDILIADDNPDHIQIVTSLLSELNCQIRIATNGLSAYKLIKQKKPTLALLDVSMPQMNGFELCKKIKTDPELKDIAVIFMTAYNDASSIDQGFKCGAQDYVLKPYNRSELLSRIKTHLSLKLRTMELEEAYRELDNFCHTVSHDLKSPILVLHQLVTLLSEELKMSLTPEIENIITRLSKKSNELIVIIEKLLEFSRMNQKVLKIEPINLNDLLEELTLELTSLEKGRHIDFDLDSLPTLQGDITLIYFLFQNILNNSIKFTRPRAIAKIHISSEETPSNYIIYITDNGVGFNSAYSQKLFNIFERLHSEKEFEGSGVGLSISKKIMERHKGHISIESTENEQTTVTLTFTKKLILT